MVHNQWKVKRFDDLTTRELYSIIKTRIDVFVVEQECPYEEADNKDQDAAHLYMEDGGRIISYARLVPAGISYPQASIGRVLVDKEYRGNGYATSLLEKSIAFITREWGEKEIKIQAQTYLQNFYRSFGFRQVSDEYLDDGIPHIDMLLQTEEK